MPNEKHASPVLKWIVAVLRHRAEILPRVAPIPDGIDEAKADAAAYRAAAALLEWESATGMHVDEA